MKTKAISLAMAVLMMCAMTTAAMAQGIVPLWDNTSSCNPDLYFSGTTAKCTARIVGQPGTTHISGRLFLQELKDDGRYETIVTWSERSTAGRFLELNGEAIRREPGVTYRTGVTATVTNADGVTAEKVRDIISSLDDGAKVEYIIRPRIRK